MENPRFFSPFLCTERVGVMSTPGSSELWALRASRHRRIWKMSELAIIPVLNVYLIPTLYKKLGGKVTMISHSHHPYRDHDWVREEMSLKVGPWRESVRAEMWPWNSHTWVKSDPCTHIESDLDKSLHLSIFQYRIFPKDPCKDTASSPRKRVGVFTLICRKNGLMSGRNTTLLFSLFVDYIPFKEMRMGSDLTEVGMVDFIYQFGRCLGWE